MAEDSAAAPDIGVLRLPRGIGVHRARRALSGAVSFTLRELGSPWLTISRLTFAVSFSVCNCRSHLTAERTTEVRMRQEILSLR